MAKPIWDQKIDKYTNWAGDLSTGYKPVKGSRVQEFIRGTLEKKWGCLYYDEVKVKYLIFADEADRDLYLADSILHGDLLLAQFDAPAPYTIQVVPVAGSPTEKGILYGTTGITLDFNFTITDSSNSQVYDSVLVTYNFLSAGVSKTTTKVFSSGETASLLIDNYLSVGTNEITVRIDGRSTGATKTVIYTWTVIQLDLSTSFQIARSIASTDSLAIPYSIQGLGSKTVEFYVDGVKNPVDDIITDVSREKTFYITGPFTPGKHTFQIRAYTTFQGANFLSKTLYREFVVMGGAGKYTTIAQDYPAGTLIAADKSNLVINCEQYVTSTIPWGYYSSDGLQAVVSWRLDGETIASREVSNIRAEVDTAPSPISFMPSQTGSHTLEAVVYESGTAVSIGSYTLSVIANTSGIHEATDALTLKLTALGRSNSEPAADRSTWNYGTITTSFNNVQWTDLSGWKDDALVLSGTSQAIIHYKPLNQQTTPAVTYGNTVEIEFETFNVEDENAVLAQIWAGGHGIQLTATKALITSVGSTTVYTNYKDSERIKLAFIINRNSGTDEKLLTYIQNNGILERAGRYALYDSYQTDSEIILGNGNSQAGIKIYSIRCYSRALTTDEEFYNYAVDSTKSAAIVEANDVYLEGTTKVSLEKMQGKLPVLTFTGPMHLLLQSSSKDTQIHCDISFVSPDDPTRNFTIEQGRVKLQGTSSLGYPRKNFKIYMKKDSCITRDVNGNIITDWQMKQGAVPCHTFTLKADFSDSSCTHNSTIARMYGDYEPDAVVNGSRVLRTPPQIVAETTYPQVVGKPFPYQLRTTPDSFPMVCFYREEYGDEWIFMGQYNFLNDKGNDFLYGFRSIYDKENPWDDTGTRLWDNQYTHCFEVLNNTDSTGLCTWTDHTKFFQTNPETGYSYWQDTFESRYPEPEGTESKAEMDELAQSLGVFHAWLASCYQVDNGGAGSQAKFDAEYEQHMSKYFFASYYSYLMRFGAVDQVNKNMMITTYDGVHWLPIRYDNDTILGQRNDTRLIYDYTITRDSLDPETGDYAYAGHTSWLWNALENCESFMAAVTAVDSALYTAGLNYDNTLIYFDETSSDRWCERIYNDNGRYKYIEPLIYEDKNYIQALQGKRQSHRHWWLRNRFDLFDAYFISGEYTNKAVRLTVPGAPEETTFSIVAGKQNYFGWGFAKTPQEAGILRQKGQSCTFTLPRQAAVGDPVYIYAASSIQELDLHSFCSNYTNAIDISGCYDDTTGTSLKKLILGDINNPNNASLTFAGFEKMSRLEYLDIQGFNSTVNFPLTGMTSLNTFKALGSGLKTFTCPSGLNFTLLELPQSVQSFVLEQVTWQTLTFTPTNNLKYVDFTKMQGANVQSFISSWIAAIENTGGDYSDKTLNLSVPKSDPWTDVPVSLMLNIAKFDSKNIRGKFVFDSSITSEDVVALTNAYGSSVWNANSPLVFDAQSGILISCDSDRLVAGNDYHFSVISFPVGTSASAVQYSIAGVIATQDLNGNYVYVKNNITLYRDTGLMHIEEDGTPQQTITVNGYDPVHSLTASIQVTIYTRTYPTTITISSPAGTMLTNTGLFTFNAVYNPSSYSGTLTSFVWSVTQSSNAAISESNKDAMTLRVSAMPEGGASESLNVQIAATFKNGTVISQTLPIQLHAPFNIADYSGNGAFCLLCAAKGIAASAGQVVDQEARAWTGENELTLASDSLNDFNGHPAGDPVRDWYFYFSNCTKLILSFPAVAGNLDLSESPNYKVLDISGCYASRTATDPINVTLGRGIEVANVGSSPYIKAVYGCKVFQGSDGLTFDTATLTSIELDNCPFSI